MKHITLLLLCIPAILFSQELGNNIMVIYHDKNINHWFGSWETGLYRYDGKTFVRFVP